MSAVERHVVHVEVQGTGTFCGVSVVHVGDRSVVCRVNYRHVSGGAIGPRYECTACGQPKRSCLHLKLAMAARAVTLGGIAAVPTPDSQRQAPDVTRQAGSSPPVVFPHHPDPTEVIP